MAKANRVNAYETPTGFAIHPWITTPDTKFNEGGVFHVKLAFNEDEPEVQNLLALIEENAKAAFEKETEGLSVAERKKWKLYQPVEQELDDDTGEPTGRVLVTFKRNHTILVEGQPKKLAVHLYDSKGNVVEDVNVFGGSLIQCAFTFKSIKVPGTKQAGVKLDFFAVRIHKLSKRTGGGFQWATKGDDDGYVHEPPADDSGSDTGDTPSSGDYE